MCAICAAKFLGALNVFGVLGFVTVGTFVLVKVLDHFDIELF